MRTLLLCAVMALGFAAVGCGGNDCEDAMDKIDECGVDLGQGKPSDDAVDKCEGETSCGAKCINDASCDDIKAALSGTQNAFLTCMVNCGS